MNTGTSSLQVRVQEQGSCSPGTAPPVDRLLPPVEGDGFGQQTPASSPLPPDLAFYSFPSQQCSQLHQKIVRTITNSPGLTPKCDNVRRPPSQLSLGFLACKRKISAGGLHGSHWLGTCPLAKAPYPLLWSPGRHRQLPNPSEHGHPGEPLENA